MGIRWVACGRGMLGVLCRSCFLLCAGSAGACVIVYLRRRERLKVESFKSLFLL